MEQSRANQGFEVNAMPQMRTIGHPHGQTGDAYGMRERGDVAVLITATFDLHAPMFDDLTAMPGDQASNLRAGEQMSHDFDPSLVWADSCPLCHCMRMVERMARRTTTDCRASLCPRGFIHRDDWLMRRPTV